MSKLRGDQEVTRILKGGLVATNLTTTATTAAGTLTLSVFSSSTQVLTGTATGYSVNLGDATQYPTTGIFFYVHNRTTQPILVKDGSGATISTIPKNFTLLAVLRSNGTVAGTWDLSGFLDGVKFADDSASPGFTFGRANNVGVDTWLQCEGIASNSTGRRVGLVDPVARQFAASCEQAASFTVTIYTHDGNEVNLATLGTLTVTSSTGGTANVDLPFVSGKQLAARLTNIAAGTVRNLLVTVTIKGGVS